MLGINRFYVLVFIYIKGGSGTIQTEERARITPMHERNIVFMRYLHTCKG